MKKEKITKKTFVYVLITDEYDNFYLLRDTNVTEVSIPRIQRRFGQSLKEARNDLLSQIFKKKGNDISSVTIPLPKSSHGNPLSENEQRPPAQKDIITIINENSFFEHYEDTKGNVHLFYRCYIYQHEDIPLSISCHTIETIIDLEVIDNDQKEVIVRAYIGLYSQQINPNLL